MIVGNAEREKYEAHIELALRHGYSSDFPLKVETTFYVPHSGPGTMASVVEVPVSVEVPVRIMAEGEGIRRLGDVSWRDYHGYSDPFRTATYFIAEGDVPRLMRSPSVGKDNTVPPAATEPFKLARWLVEQVSQEIKGISEPTGTKTRDAARALAESRIRDGLTSSPLVVGRDGKVTLARVVDVPHYVVVPQNGKPPIDAARWDVVVDRPQDFEALNWRGLGLRFEPWEADIVGRVMRCYGMKHDPVVPDAIGFPEDAASDLAVINRLSVNSLLPLFIKRVMLDLSSSAAGMAEDIRTHTSAAYGAVARGEWGSPALEGALAALNELWKYDPRVSAFGRSKGWDLPLSPFEIMTARVEAFPWRGPNSEAAPRPSSPAP